MLAAIACGAHRLSDDMTKAARWMQSFGVVPHCQKSSDGQAFIAAEYCAVSAQTLFHGWIDNSADLAAGLQLSADNPAEVYDAALSRWGDEADLHIFGHYAAITWLSDGGLRLSRSPWTAPPLSYAFHEQRILAGSLPGLFAALGCEPDYDYDAILDQVAMDEDPAVVQRLLRNIHRVPLGSIVHCREGQADSTVWYDIEAVLASKPAPDEDCAERCAELLGEACAAAARHARRPGLALSGGLDSPMVASELLRQDPGKGLTSFTFVPDPEWNGPDAAGAIADEWPVVERFAAIHPGLRAHRANPAQGGIDYRYRDIARTAGVFNAGASLHGAHHAVWTSAKEHGCDWLFTADLGNVSFSADGRWAYAEYAGKGRWGLLLKLLRDRPHDPRPLWRKLAALAILPLLPAKLRAFLQGLIHPDRQETLRWNTVLSEQAKAAYRSRAAKRGSRPVWEGFTYPRDRKDAARRDWAAHKGDTAEITLALELYYGVRYRDVTAYRPLIEYCLSLPTEEFIQPGQTRHLAKRMAVGRMPDKQYQEALHGAHNVDWLVRLRREVPRLRSQVAAMRDHHWLSEHFDLDRLDAMLATLPERESDNLLEHMPILQAVGRAIVAGQFIGLIEGRNDF